MTPKISFVRFPLILMLSVALVFAFLCTAIDISSNRPPRTFKLIQRNILLPRNKDRKPIAETDNPFQQGEGPTYRSRITVTKVMQSFITSNNQSVLVSDVLPDYCKVCSCRLLNDGLYTDCSVKGLKQIFNSLDRQTVFLNMSHNEIENVTNNVFIGLSNVRVLDLSFNRIHSIDLKSFLDMTNLEVMI